MGKFVYGKESGTVFIAKKVKKYTLYALQREDFRGEGFLGGPVFSSKWGLKSFWGKCLKQIRVSDNVSFTYIQPRITRFTIEMLHRNFFVYGKICICERIRNRKYSRKGEKNILHMPSKEKISREEGFLGRLVFSRKQGLERFWGKCLKQIRVSDNASFTDIQP